MPSLNNLFESLWQTYSSRNPLVQKIHDLFEAEGETVVNDHIALRTFNHDSTNKEILSAIFLEHGYEARDTYAFSDKKLVAFYLEPPEKNLPKVFISELELNKCSSGLQFEINSLVDQIPALANASDDFCNRGILWKPISYNIYQGLKEESEYAAWMAAFGFCANHFTISVNHLKNYNTIEKVNTFITENGFTLNDTGGTIKGSPSDYLEQSSVMADPVKVEFADGPQSVPCCYYEFARRYPGPDGTLFPGFLSSSANNIFTSTDNSDRS